MMWPILSYLVTHEGRIINSHDRIFLTKCSLSNKKTLQRQKLTFLTVFASEAIHTLALLPGPVVQTGAPMSAGAGGAGSFQSRTSTETQTVNQLDKSAAQSAAEGSPPKEKLKKKGQMSRDFSPHAAIQKTHKEPQGN